MVDWFSKGKSFGHESVVFCCKSTKLTNQIEVGVSSS